MAEVDSGSYRNVRALVGALEQLDALMIKACLETMVGTSTTRVIPVNEDDLRILENSQKGYQYSNYDMADMLQYLAKTSEHG